MKYTLHGKEIFQDGKPFCQPWGNLLDATKIATALNLRERVEEYIANYPFTYEQKDYGSMLESGNTGDVATAAGEETARSILIELQSILKDFG